uniref:DYW domain-containing protein n=1 Tax=Salix viminalis TaxID=40686 RepID=A0A6N2MU51_SALVM
MGKKLSLWQSCFKKQSNSSSGGPFPTSHLPSRSKFFVYLSLALSFAILAFSQIRTPSTNDWNAIIRGFIQSPNPTNAFAWYKSMISKSRKVDALTCSFVLKACARVLARLESIQVHTHIVRKGFIADALLGTTLLDVYAKVGDIDSAEKVFDEMVKRDIASWNALISGFAQGSKPTEALSLFNRMEIDGLYGFREYELQEGYRYMEYNDHGILRCMLVEMGSNHCGDFVLLSNVYAARERWADVGRVREAMKNRDVKKVPGLSYIEGNGVIHKFYNADKSHESWREIYAKLDEIRFRVKEYGYVAETSFVLHDIGEEDKENVLGHHSEKLAVAFGLVSTREGTPIQVIKNLGFGDCHFVSALSEVG